MVYSIIVAQNARTCQFRTRNLRPGLPPNRRLEERQASADRPGGDMHSHR